MKIAIDKIKIMERIRKEITRIDELAADIRQNGLINAITVMPLDGGEFQLLAGFRRMKAAQSLGWTEIEGHVVSAADAEAALRVEISENEQREPFTITEKVYFGLLLEEIEAVKAKKRMSNGGKGGLKEGTVARPYLVPGESRNVIGAKINMSGRQYDRAKYIVANATPEVIEQLDKGERTIYQTYNELRAGKKADKLDRANDCACIGPENTQPGQQPQKPGQAKTKSDFKLASDSRAAKNDPYLAQLRAEEAEHNRIVREFDALSPEGKIADLQRQLREERARAAGAESELTRLKELRHNDVYHNEAIIEGLKRQNAELIGTLAVADARIQELEAAYGAA